MFSLNLDQKNGVVPDKTCKYEDCTLNGTIWKPHSLATSFKAQNLFCPHDLIRPPCKETQGYFESEKTLFAERDNYTHHNNYSKKKDKYLSAGKKYIFSFNILTK